MQTEWKFIIVVVGVSAGKAAYAAVDYAAPGPEAFTTTDFANGTAGSLGGKLVVPNRAGKYPLLVNTHGFSGNAGQQIGWGEHFASYGFVAVVPSMPGGLPPDHKGNGDIIRALALLFSDPTYASPAQAKVDAERIGLSGHSAGGLQTTFAAAILKPRATVLFDPVDYQMTGRPVYATLCSPVMGIFAEPGSCNTQAEWSTFKTTSVGPQVFLDVVGSNHCDPINPAMFGCASSPPANDGASPGTTPPAGSDATAISGCDCSVVARPYASSSVASGWALLLATAAIGRRRGRAPACRGE